MRDPVEHIREVADFAARRSRQSSIQIAPSRQHDFFSADIKDAAPKADMASMEHPFFSLKVDMCVRIYNYNDHTIKITPGHCGSATIYDKDIWIYCVSQLVDGLNKSRDDINRRIRFKAYDFLTKTKRESRKSGRAYQRMSESLDRLAGTRIETNIQTAGRCERDSFGLIDSWRVITRDGDKRMVAVEVTLSDWLWRSVQSFNVLTLDPDYFKLRKPLDRRIYELARKHCGKQPDWPVRLHLLYEKSGSRSTLREFRSHVKALAVSGALPGYKISFLAPNSLLFTRKAKDDLNP
jgi:plasmid replication initiation protein